MPALNSLRGWVNAPRSCPEGWHCVNVFTQGFLRAGNIDLRYHRVIEPDTLVGYCIQLDRAMGQACMDALNDWCEECCKGMVIINPARHVAAAEYWFERKQDAAAFKLVWC
jgi:hypothetical protein